MPGKKLARALVSVLVLFSPPKWVASENILTPIPMETSCADLPCQVALLPGMEYYFHDGKLVDKIAVHDGYVQGYMDRSKEFKKPEFVFAFTAMGKKRNNKAFSYNYFVRDDWMPIPAGSKLKVTVDTIEKSGSTFGETFNGKVTSLVRRGLQGTPALTNYVSNQAVVISYFETDSTNSAANDHTADKYQIILSRGTFNGQDDTNMFLVIYEDLQATKMHGIYAGAGGDDRDLHQTSKVKFCGRWSARPLHFSKLSATTKTIWASTNTPRISTILF